MTFFTEAANTVKNYSCPGNAFLPHSIVIPLNNEKDSTFVPSVKPGDLVQEGQEIASYKDPKDKYISKLYSSIPGKVEEIIPCFCANGKQKFGIKINFGGKFNYVGKKPEVQTSELLIKNTVISKLTEYGILNTFRIYKAENLGNQIKKNQNKKNLVVRLFDDDNYRYTDSLITKFYFPQLLEAAKTLAKVIDAEGVLFALNAKQENKTEILKEQAENIAFVQMNIKRYPSGTEREIVSAYNRNVRKNCKLQISKKDLFIDSSTLYEVYKAVNLGIPPISKNIFISGNCLKASCLIDVKTGITLRELVNQIGGFAKEPSKIIINGLISGNSITSLDVPVTQYVKSVIFLSKTSITDTQIFSCINCGNCRFVCPTKISPDILYNNLANFMELPPQIAKTALACTNCGLCNIRCPARLPISQSITQLKEKLLQEKISEITNTSEQREGSINE